MSMRRMMRRVRRMTTMTYPFSPLLLSIEVKKPSPASGYPDTLPVKVVVQYALCMRRLQRQGGFFLSNAAFISAKSTLARTNFWFGQFSLGPLLVKLVFIRTTFCWVYFHLARFILGLFSLNLFWPILTRMTMMKIMKMMKNMMRILLYYT